MHMLSSAIATDIRPHFTMKSLFLFFYMDFNTASLIILYQEISGTNGLFRSS